MRSNGWTLTGIRKDLPNVLVPRRQTSVNKEEGKCRILLPGSGGPRLTLQGDRASRFSTSGRLRGHCYWCTIVICNCTFFAGNGGRQPRQSLPL